LIDEADRATDFDVFIIFLGLLRDMYLKRNKDSIPAFQSVILAGVHDIKNLKKKIRPESERAYNSPWNIAADFDIDLSFSAPEIEKMLEEFEKGHHTGMDLRSVASRIFYYTSGYPYLVSFLCKTIDEGKLEWSIEGVDEAEKRLVRGENTLFDDLIKNIEMEGTLREKLRGILLEGREYSFVPYLPGINVGAMYGIIKRSSEGRVQVSNTIFETVLYAYFTGLEESSQHRFSTGEDA